MEWTDIFGTFRWGTAKQADMLTMIPLLSAAVDDDDEAIEGGSCVVLDDAEAGGLVEAHELDAGAQVPRIAVEVRGEKPLLLREGEILRGAKQNRAIDLTLLLPPGKYEVPVSCVEARRWHVDASEPLSGHFKSSGAALDSSLRRHKMHRTLETLRSAGPLHSDQGATWAAVRRKLEKLEAILGTEDYLAAVEKERDRVLAAMDSLSPEPGQAGAIFCRNGEVLGLEIVDSPATWSRVWRKVAQTYISESLEDSRLAGMHPAARAADEREDREAGMTKRRRMSTVLFNQVVRQGAWVETPSPVGVGTHVTSADGLVGGFALLGDDVCWHAFLYPAVGEDGVPAAMRGGMAG